MRLGCNMDGSNVERSLRFGWDVFHLDMRCLSYPFGLGGGARLHHRPLIEACVSSFDKGTWSPFGQLYHGSRSR